MLSKQKNIIRLLIIGGFLLVAGLTFWIVSSYLLRDNIAPEDTSATSCKVGEIVEEAFSGSILTQNDFAFIVSPIVEEPDAFEYKLKLNESSAGLYVSIQKDEKLYVFRARDCKNTNEGLAELVKMYPLLKPAR